MPTLLPQFPADADFHSQAWTVPTDHRHKPDNVTPWTHHISFGAGLAIHTGYTLQESDKEMRCFQCRMNNPTPHAQTWV